LGAVDPKSGGLGVRITLKIPPIQWGAIPFFHAKIKAWKSTDFHNPKKKDKKSWQKQKAQKRP
jgi:hypothetical protein